MEARAVVRYVSIAPRKVRLVVDLVRNRDVESALEILKFNNKTGAVPVEKVIRSALANAGQNCWPTWSLLQCPPASAGS